MDKDTILDYVTETPGNTNRAVLSGMLDSMDSGGNEMLVVGLIAQTGNYDFTTDKTYDEIAESIYNGNYNIVLAGLNNVAGGKVHHLRAVNYGGYEKYGGISNIVFSCLDGSYNYALQMLPTNQNTATGTVIQFVTK